VRSVLNMARAMLLHASCKWRDGIDASLWPMAVKYAVYLFNHLPNAQQLFPADIFTGNKVPRHQLLSIHIWGCQVYVLAGQKIPRWQPRSRQGIFMGFSNLHSSEVPLVLNLNTGSITPQFHVVFDDHFTTVSLIRQDDSPPKHWEDLYLKNSISIVEDQETSDKSPNFEKPSNNLRTKDEKEIQRYT
jgi:hypothetical protein